MALGPIVLVLGLIAAVSCRTEPAARPTTGAGKRAAPPHRRGAEAQPERTARSRRAAGGGQPGATHASAPGPHKKERPSPAGPREAQRAEARLLEPDWFELAGALADRQAIGRGLSRATATDPETGKRRAYAVPAGSYLLGVRIVHGVGQPGYQLYSLRDTGFMYSWSRFWPASAIKLVAAVGALWTLHEHGLDGRVRLRLSDADGAFDGSFQQILRRALVYSANTAYNRLMLIAGLRRLNERYLTARWGLPLMVLQRRYTHPSPNADLRDSPAIHYEQGERRGTIAPRHYDTRFARCPDEANCTTLFELQDVLRRVMLHSELPADQRYPLRDADIERLRKLLAAAPNKLEPGASKALLGKVSQPWPRRARTHPKVPNPPPGDRRVLVYNKAGRVPGDDHLDNTFIVDTVHRRRYMLALSVPYSSPREPDEITAAQLVELGGHALGWLAHRSTRGVWLQHDAGVTIEAALSRAGPAVGDYQLRVRASGATRCRAWLGRRPLTGRRPSKLPARIRVSFARRGERHLVLVAYRAGRAVGYRALRAQLSR